MKHYAMTYREAGRSENSLSFQNSNPDPLVVQLVASRYTDYATVAFTCDVNFYDFGHLPHHCANNATPMLN
jgi:hypothetical protein